MLQDKAIKEVEDINKSLIEKKAELQRLTGQQLPTPLPPPLPTPISSAPLFQPSPEETPASPTPTVPRRALGKRPLRSNISLSNQPLFTATSPLYPEAKRQRQQEQEEQENISDLEIAGLDHPFLS